MNSKPSMDCLRASWRRQSPKTKCSLRICRTTIPNEFNRSEGAWWGLRLCRWTVARYKLQQNIRLQRCSTIKNVIRNWQQCTGWVDQIDSRLLLWKEVLTVTNSCRARELYCSLQLTSYILITLSQTDNCSCCIFRRVPSSRRRRALWTATNDTCWSFPNFGLVSFPFPLM